SRLSERFSMRKGHSSLRSVRVAAVIVVLSVPRFATAQQVDSGGHLPLMIPSDEVAANRNSEIEKAIARLASSEFSERQAAQQQLVAAGGDAVSGVMASAQSDELEVAIRCVEILRELARQEQHATVAIDAVKDLSTQEGTAVATYAARVHAELT